MRIIGRAFDGFERAFARQLEGLNAEYHPLNLQDLEHQVLHGETTADVLLLITDWLPALIQAQKLRPIDAANIEGWPEAWCPALRTQQQDQDGNTYGIAYHDGPMLFLYRKDLYEDPNEQKGFSQRFGYALKAPLDWNQFRDQAIWFTRPEQGLYGTVQAGFPDGHNTVYDFLTQFWSRGGDLQKGLDTPAARETISFFNDLWHVSKVINPQAKHWDSVESGQRFAAGEAAMMVNWAGFAALPTTKPLGCAPVPGATTLNAYWVLAIPSSAKDPAASNELISRITTHEMDVVTALSGGSATRRDSWTDPRVLNSAPYYPVLEAAHRNSRSTPADPQWPHQASILNELMRSVIEGGH